LCSGLFNNPVPRKVIWFWSVLTLGLLLFLGGWTYQSYKDSKQARDNKSMNTKAKKNK
jgi:hypothetical protein